jgi:hypothetical protein
VNITKQTTIIQSNTRHVYLNSKRYFYMMLLLYMIRSVRRLSPGMSIQKSYEGRYNKSVRGPYFTISIFIMLKFKYKI